jgi:hypothetical protein
MSAGTSPATMAGSAGRQRTGSHLQMQNVIGDLDHAPNQLWATSP